VPEEIRNKLTKPDVDAKFTSKLIKNEDGSYSANGDVKVPKSLIKDGKFTIKFKDVGGDFSCDNNRLVSLEGAPETVGGDFWCSNNPLTSLEGAPKTVGGYFWCDNNQLTSLEGAPKTVGGGFWCSNNKKKFTEEEIRKYTKVKGDVMV